MTATEAVWTQYRAWLEQHVPEAFANLAPGANEEQLAALEAHLGYPLPEELKQLLRLNNGQRLPADCCAFPGLVFLSTAHILEQWQVWDRLRAGETEQGLEALDDHAHSLDPGVLDQYTNPGWIPLLRDGARADYVGLDMVPTDGGVPGQVINFGRDEDQHFVAFPSLSGLLEFWLAEIQTDCWSVDPPEPPTYPYAWFKHQLNGIDVLRRFCDRRRASA
jgi:cell wall assembly regulator SMI1